MSHAVNVGHGSQFQRLWRSVKQVTGYNSCLSRSTELSSKLIWWPEKMTKWTRHFLIHQLWTEHFLMPDFRHRGTVNCKQYYTTMNERAIPSVQSRQHKWRTRKIIDAQSCVEQLTCNNKNSISINVGDYNIKMSKCIQKLVHRLCHTKCPVKKTQKIQNTVN